MKTAWDYSSLAAAYVKRPDYADQAIDKMLGLALPSKSGTVCDVGAGVGHLTIALATRGYDIVAVEPNDNMRALGIERTKQFNKVKWFEGTGENTGRESAAFDLVTFGSSFNVCDRQLALKETCRLLKPSGWFACMWNHRDLNDPIQARFEAAIKANIDGYSYGTRREDQTEVIDQSGLFKKTHAIEGDVFHTQSKAECLEAWRSHATLERQAGGNFHKIIQDISAILETLPGTSIRIPYTTRIWVAQARK